MTFWRIIIRLNLADYFNTCFRRCIGKIVRVLGLLQSWVFKVPPQKIFCLGRKKIFSYDTSWIDFTKFWSEKVLLEARAAKRIGIQIIDLKANSAWQF